MKKTLNLLLVLFPIVAICQSQTENYIKTITYKDTTATSITNPSALQASQSITYFDGLGRPVQQVAHLQSGSGKDIVTPIEYDVFGRQEKEYLPYVPTAAGSLNYKTTALADVATFYNTTVYENTSNPYSKKEFEASPLNRVMKQAAPGNDWKLGNGHEIRFDYLTNTDTDQVRNFGVSFIAGNTENPSLEDEGIYAPSQLYKTITKDENWKANQTYPNDHTTEEYKDKEGHIVLKRTFDADKWHDTYYVYDDYGNLTYVLPPKVSTYKNLAQQNWIGKQYFFEDVSTLFNYVDYDDISFYFSQSGYLTIYPYASGSMIQLRNGLVMNLDFITPSLPDMNLGNMYFEDGSLAGSAYIQSGNLYFNSSGLVDTSGYFYNSLTVNLQNYNPPPISHKELENLAYQYKYDKRNRLVEKKLPGKGWEYIVYDKLDRPILTQDANLKTAKKWLFTKYDTFGRPVYTGEYVNIVETTRAAVQALGDAGTILFETKQGANNINGTTVYYSNNAFPNAANINLFTINYYDDYDFDLNGGTSTASYNITPITNVKGLATGSKVRILDTTNWTTNVSYYDSKSRPIYSYSKNDYLASTSMVKSQLDFVGKTLETTSSHQRNNGTIITVVDSFIYDHAGRLTKQTQAINGATMPEVIAENVYDELGQLNQKKVGGRTNQNRLQTVDYTYNIRGWLKGINDNDIINNAITMGSGDLFGFQINYNNPSSGTGLYNGNISQTFWKTASTASTSLKNYTYSYDALNRIKTATYGENNVVNNKFNEIISGYDRNGNIEQLMRNMQSSTNPNSYAAIDYLTYTYDLGNKLLEVKDANGLTGDGKQGFKDGSINFMPGPGNDYSYDANGNMKFDANKAITSITYNHLNLPKTININDNDYLAGNILYVYDALGVKLKKTVYEIGRQEPDTYYAGNYVYEGNNLKFFNQPEGYIAPKNENDLSQGFNYIYQYKDHLGNIRLSYKDASGTTTPSLQIIEENNYYPFGLKHKDSNNMVTSTNPAQKYKYNGKELQDELELNTYTYGWRDYDPAIGRFNKMDRFSEKYYSLSTYSYAGNNPIVFVDIQGDSISAGSQSKFDRLQRKVERVRDRQQRKADRINSKADRKGWTDAQRASELGDTQSRIASLNGTVNNLNNLESSTQFYRLESGSGELGGTTYDTTTGEIVISYGSSSNFVHESTHAGQFEAGDIAFSSANGASLLQDLGDEASAYSAQYAFKPKSVSGLTSTLSINSISDITNAWVQGIQTSTGATPYGLGGIANTGITPINMNSTRADLVRAYPGNSAISNFPVNLNLRTQPTIYFKR